MCERKAYPHRVYRDRNRIQLRVNGAWNKGFHDHRLKNEKNLYV